MRCSLKISFTCNDATLYVCSTAIEYSGLNCDHHVALLTFGLVEFLVLGKITKLEDGIRSTSYFSIYIND